MMSKEERDKLTREAKKMFSDELRMRVDAYFRIIVQTLRVLLNLLRISYRRTSVSSW